MMTKQPEVLILACDGEITGRWLDPPESLGCYLIEVWMIRALREPDFVEHLSTP